MNERMEISQGLAPGLARQVPPEVMAARAVPVLTLDLLASLNDSVGIGDAEDAQSYIIDYQGFQCQLRKLLEESAELIKATTGLMDGRGTFSEWLGEVMDVQNVLEQFVLRFKEYAPEYLVECRSIRKAKIHRTLSRISTEQAQALLEWRTANPEEPEPGSIAGGE